MFEAAAPRARCVLCGATPTRVVWREGSFAALACRCGLTSTWPPPPDGMVDPTRDGHSRGFYRFPARLKARWLVAALGGRLGRRPRLLEIGCGEGWLLEAARRVGFDPVGIEPHAGRAAAARARARARVIESLFEEVDAQATDLGRFDVVFHIDLLAHFPDPAGALVRMRELLAPGGAVVCEVGLLGGVDPRWYAAVGGLGMPQHRWFYSEEALDRLFAGAALRIVHRRRFGLAPLMLGLTPPRAAVQLLARAAGGLVSRRDGGAPLAEPVRRRVHDSISATFARLEAVLRYRLGALTPRVGPGTLFVVAVPAREARP